MYAARLIQFTWLPFYSCFWGMVNYLTFTNRARGAGWTPKQTETVFHVKHYCRSQSSIYCTRFKKRFNGLGLNLRSTSLYSLNPSRSAKIFLTFSLAFSQTHSTCVALLVPHVRFATLVRTIWQGRIESRISANPVHEMGRRNAGAWQQWYDRLRQHAIEDGRQKRPGRRRYATGIEVAAREM